MRKVLLITALLFFSLIEVKAQNWSEGFEGIDSLSLPSGWAVYNRAGFPIPPFTNWTVRDSGLGLPGLQNATSKSHSGLKSIGVSWWASQDTNGIGAPIADAWLVTKKIHVWSGTAEFSYWAALGGGSANYRDSMQIWVSTGDSLPQSFTHYLSTETGTGPYGQFTQYYADISPFNGQDIYVAFRYYMDCAVDGFFINLDDVNVVNPIGIQPIGNEIPIKFDLKQNYPNPFNPVTNIEFAIAKTSSVNLIVYNSLGQLVSELVNQEMKPGVYRYDFNASNLPSGAYFYRLTAGDFVKTNKMVLVK